MRLALKASKSAIGMFKVSVQEVCVTDLGVDASELNVANYVLQKAAEYVGRLINKAHTAADSDSGGTGDTKGLEAEYFILRTALVSLPHRCRLSDHR